MIGTELVEVDRNSMAASREGADYFSSLPDLRDSDGLMESLMLSDPKVIQISGDDGLETMQQVASKSSTTREEQRDDQGQTKAAEEDSESASGESDQEIGDESDEDL